MKGLNLRLVPSAALNESVLASGKNASKSCRREDNLAALVLARLAGTSALEPSSQGA